MPHIIVKMDEGKSLAEKQALAHAIARTVAGFDYDIRKVSISVDHIRPEEWMDTVYQPDIKHRPLSLIPPPSDGPASQYP
jgi:4-oxalocrotonate tautomerase